MYASTIAPATGTSAHVRTSIDRFVRGDGLRGRQLADTARVAHPKPHDGRDPRGEESAEEDQDRALARHMCHTLREFPSVLAPRPDESRPGTCRLRDTAS